MRHYMQWMRQEVPTLMGMAIFTIVILLAISSSTWLVLLFLALQSGVYLVAVIAHEYAHLVVARSRGITAELSWRPRPSVTCQDIDRVSAWLVGVAGPLAGALVGAGGLLGLAIATHASVLLYALAVAVAGMHLTMLLPAFPDGRMAWGN